MLDLVLTLMRRVRQGERLAEIQADTLGVDTAQISAAYSWILQHYRPDDLKPDTPRVLHLAERMLISPAAYGYLLTLVHERILDAASLEKVIEKIMFQSLEKAPLDKIKALVAEVVFEKGLSGSETIH